MDPSKRHICLVVSPLRSLMRDQVNRWSQLGIHCSLVLPKIEMDMKIVKGIYLHYICTSVTLQTNTMCY